MTTESQQPNLFPLALPVRVGAGARGFLAASIIAAAMLLHSAPAKAQSGDEVVRPWSCLTYSVTEGSLFGRPVPPPGCAVPAVAFSSLATAHAIVPPAAPAGLTATVNGTTVILRWTPSNGAVTSYVVQVGSASGLADMANANTESASPMLTATNVPDGNYYFRVLAQSDSGPSAVSREVSVRVGIVRRFQKNCAYSTPPASTALTTTQFTDAGGPQVRFDWRAGEEEDCQAFNPVTCCYWLEYGTSLGADRAAGAASTLIKLGHLELPIGSLAGRTTFTVALTGVASGVYFVQVRGVGNFGPGAPSNIVTVNVGNVCTGPPAAPTRLRATVAGSTVVLVWDETSSLRDRPLAYSALVSPAIQGVARIGIGGPLTSHAGNVFGLFRTTAVPAGNYTWQITATNACGTSAASTTTSNVTGPSVPVRVTAMHGWQGAPRDGGNWSTLILGRDGNLYGTTSSGGPLNSRCVQNRDGCGVIFKISQTGLVTILYSFGTATGPSVSGPPIYPFASLVQASDGSFWGTTVGQEWGRFGPGAASVYKMAADGSSVTFISELGGPSYSVPMQASDGTMWGTTIDNGAGPCSWQNIPVCTPTTGSGTVWKVTNNQLSYVHAFNGTNGAKPYAGLIQATDGTLWGTTSLGGAFGAGTIFKIVGGVFTSVYSFRGGSDGANPAHSPMLQASDGNFYGTTQFGGGPANQGTFFKMTPAGVVTILHSFTGLLHNTGDDEVTTAEDGLQPGARPTEGPDGMLYGVTGGGGAFGGGIAYKIKKDGSDYQQLYTFAGTDEGGGLTSTLILGPDGNYYGTSQYGGRYNWGAIYQMTAPQ